MKIEISPKSTQKIPQAEDNNEEKMRKLYKKETGKNAIIKRGGQWEETKLYNKWQDKYYAQLETEIEEEQKEKEIEEEQEEEIEEEQEEIEAEEEKTTKTSTAKKIQKYQLEVSMALKTLWEIMANTMEFTSPPSGLDMEFLKAVAAKYDLEEV